MDSGEENLFSKRENRSKELFDSFEFENQLLSIVEELRLKRKLEEENESTIKSLLDEKYMMERKLDEQKRMHQNEKVLLEEMISQLKKTIEDGFCISNDEKEKQQTLVQSFQQEIRALKDEARVQRAEKINQEKKVQELEGKLKLCNSFQESTIRQVSDIRERMKSLMQYCQDLSKMQEEVKKNVNHANSVYAEFRISTNHLLQSLSIMKKKNSSLKHEVISLRVQLHLQKESNDTSEAIERLANSEPLKGLHNVLAVEEMLLMSQQQNKEIMKNLAESSDLVNQYVIRVEESEKDKEEALAQFEESKEEVRRLQDDLEARTKNLKQIEKEYAKAIRKWEEKEAMKEGRWDVGVQTEVIDSVPSENISSVESRCEKSTNVTGQDIKENHFKDASVQTDYHEGNDFSSVGSSQDACHQSSGEILHAFASDTQSAGGESSPSVHEKCSNINDPKLDKKHLSETDEETAACCKNHNYDKRQVSQLADSMTDSDHMEKYIDTEGNISDQDHDFIASTVTEGYEDQDAKGTLSNKKTSSENEVSKLTGKYSEDCDRSLSNMENVCNSSEFVGTPKAVKRQYEKSSITSPAEGKKRICERSTSLHLGDDIVNVCRPEKHNDCVNSMLNAGSLATMEPYVEVTEESVHFCYLKKHASNIPYEAMDVVTSDGQKDSGSFLTGRKCSTTTCTIADKKQDLNGEVFQLHKAVKPTENLGKNIGSPKNVANMSSDVKNYGEICGEMSHGDLKVMENRGTDEASLTDVILSWDLEINEETSSHGEKLSCDKNKICQCNDAIEHEKQTDYTGNTTNISSTIKRQTPIARSVNEKSGGSGSYIKKQILTSGKTGSCSKENKDNSFELSALKSPVDSLENVKRCALSDRFFQTCDAGKSGIYEKLYDGQKIVPHVSNTIVTPLERKTTKRHLESDNVETAASNKKPNFGEKISPEDTAMQCSPSLEKCCNCMGDGLYLSTSTSATTQETYVFGNKQLSSDTNVCTSHDEKDNITKFSIMPVTFLPSEEAHNTFNESEINVLNDSLQDPENHGIYASHIELNVNTSPHENRDESKEKEKCWYEVGDKTHGERTVHHKHHGSDDNKAFIPIYSSKSQSDWKMSDTDSTKERCPGTVKENVSAEEKTMIHSKKQPLNKIANPPSYGKLKAFGYKFKPPILKSPSVKDMLYKTDKEIQSEKRSFCSENSASQIGDTEPSIMNRETYVSNVKNVSHLSAHRVGASEQKIIKGQGTGIAACDKSISSNEFICDRNSPTGVQTSQDSYYNQSCEAHGSSMDSTATDQNEVGRAQRKVTKSDDKFADTEGGTCGRDMEERACFSAKHISCEGNKLDVSVPPLASSESEAPERHSVEAKREAGASNFLYKAGNKISSGSLLKTSVQCSADMDEETNCEEKNNFRKVLQIISPEKTIDCLRNDNGKANLAFILNAPKGERDNSSGEDLHKKELSHNECKLFVLKDTAKHSCSFEGPAGNGRKQQNINLTEGISVTKNDHDDVHGNTIENDKKQSYVETDAYLHCSNGRSTSCFPESPSATGDQTLSDKMNAFSANKSLQNNEKLGQSSGKQTDNFGTSRSTCKYSETTIRSHISAAYVRTSLAGDTHFSQSEVLEDKTIIENSSFSKEHIDHVSNVTNASFGSSSTMETKVIKRHIVETKYETVLCEKKEVAGETQVSPVNKSSYRPFKTPILKFSSLTGILDNESCKQSQVSSKNEVLPFVVTEKNEHCDGTRKTVLNANICSTATTQQKTVKEFGKVPCETLPHDGNLGESKHGDTVGSVLLPEKHIDCAISALTCSSQAAGEPEAVKSYVLETSGKVEVLGSHTGKEMDFLKTPIVRYPPALSAFSAAHKENTPSKEVKPNNNPVPYFSNTNLHT